MRKFKLYLFHAAHHWYVQAGPPVCPWARLGPYESKVEARNVRHFFADRVREVVEEKDPGRKEILFHSLLNTLCAVNRLLAGRPGEIPSG
jgi:hypothetical protein